MRIRKLAALVVVPLVFGLAGCGSTANDPSVASANNGKSTPSPTVSISPQDAMLKFAQCMRKNGVDMKDPQPGQPFTFHKKANSGHDDKALQACDQFLQAGGGPAGPLDDPKSLDAMVKFAGCMRQHGINVADPKPGKMGLMIPRGSGSQAKIEAAQKACQQYLPGVMQGRQAGPKHAPSEAGGSGNQNFSGQSGAGQ